MGMIKRPSEFLTANEVKALLRIPDRRTLKGRRDYALLLLICFAQVYERLRCAASSIENLSTFRH